MSASLLTTKLYVPPPRPNLVARPRLVERLNLGLCGKLTFISAPAGFGKTTLISQWLGCVDRPFTWLSLEENDNDPAHFFACLIAALHKVDPDIGQAAQAMMLTPQPPPQEIFLLFHPLILVLDDYHLISTLPIHQQVTFLLEHQPPQMHLVLITREDPLLPLSRLRARSQMTEIRQDDLRFSLQECADFLQRVMGISLSEEEVAVLERSTEGWIAGLQLAALSIQGQDDLKGFFQVSPAAAATCWTI